MVLAAALWGTAAAQGQFTHDGCPNVAENQFKLQSVVGRGSATSPLLSDNTLTEPLKLAFDLRPDNSVDMYIAQRGGAIKKYHTGSNTLVTVGTVPVSTYSEWGLTGLALDPDFKTNHHIYVYYATASPYAFHLARLTLNAAHTQFLDNNMSSEKRLLSISASQTCCHTGGALAFDDLGDLWVAVGKNATDYPDSYSETNVSRSTEATAANAADLRGGILRIHPDDSPRGYSVPAGNYGEYWADYFQANGKPDLAAEYRDTARVKPEIYVKGSRNPYTLAIDRARKRVAWGEFGVNTTNTYTEENNLITHPIFGGYPYYAGGFGTGAGTGFYSLWQGGSPGTGAGTSQWTSAHSGQTQTLAAPVNNSVHNKGPRTLPPVTPALHTYSHASGAGAVTGPLYRYDGASPSTIKFPPHFDGAWFLTDWSQGNSRGVRIYKLNTAGTEKIDSLNWFQNYAFSNPIAFEQGPDGALYVINYSGWFNSSTTTNIVRIEYTGSCRPTSIRPTIAKVRVRALGNRVKVEEREFSLEVRDISGRLLKSVASETGPRSYAARDLAPEANGVLLVTVSSARGSESFRLFRD